MFAGFMPETFFVFTLVTGPRRSLSLKLSDAWLKTLGPASGEEGTTYNIYMKAKARIWPWLSYMCQIRSTALCG